MPTLFGTALREARKASGKTIKELAISLGFSNTYVSDVELGLRPPPKAGKIIVAANECSIKPETLIAAAARDRVSLAIPVSDDMGDDVLMALVRVRIVLNEPGKVSLKKLRSFFESRRR